MSNLEKVLWGMIISEFVGILWLVWAVHSLLNVCA